MYITIGANGWILLFIERNVFFTHCMTIAVVLTSKGPVWELKTRCRH